ncbi:MAG TPA: HmuY family protein [Sphingobacterium bovisgrunnientis]|jgi:hypothetical protein|nr:HmuY family protein [Sphingobacterium bovisgrunnientis]
MIKINTLLATSIVVISMISCSKSDTEPIIVIPPSSGSTLTLNGLISNESGSSAGNSVYVDLSSDIQTPIARDSWDLGFYSGSDFRVILNNSVSAAATVTAKNSLTEVGEADTLNLTLAINQGAPDAEHFKNIDGLNGTLESTVIPAISNIDTENKVIILNRGTGGGVAKRPWIKLKISKSSNGGYTLQYGTIKQTTNFKSVQVSKDEAYNFKFISLNAGSEVKVEPKKDEWDFVWGYSVYQTSFGPSGLVAYNFSDLVFINIHAKTEIAEILTTENFKYDTFKSSDLTNAIVKFSKNRDVIGANWRATTGTTAGVKTDRFYVVKDSKGNNYKLKFNSFGAGNDGGTRGKPVIQYELLK